LFPEAVPVTKRFSIPESDRKFVMQYMSQLPRETRSPSYFRDTTYYDASYKFLLFGNDRTQIPPTLRVFNKIGDAYGFMIDNAYVVDFEHNIEFMLSAVIDCDTDGNYNDGVYEYERIGYPFMKNLGQLIYHYEIKRKRMNAPDLSSFKLKYDQTSQ
jgi:hypothetical protein